MSYSVLLYPAKKNRWVGPFTTLQDAKRALSIHPRGGEAWLIGSGVPYPTYTRLPITLWGRAYNFIHKLRSYT